MCDENHVGELVATTAAIVGLSWLNTTLSCTLPPLGVVLGASVVILLPPVNYKVLLFLMEPH